jgi:hypothetical protein
MRDARASVVPALLSEARKQYSTDIQTRRAPTYHPVLPGTYARRPTARPFTQHACSHEKLTFFPKFRTDFYGQVISHSHDYRLTSVFMAATSKGEANLPGWMVNSIINPQYDTIAWLV